MSADDSTSVGVSLGLAYPWFWTLDTCLNQSNVDLTQDICVIGLNTKFSLPTRIDAEMAFGVYITSEKGEEALLVNNAVGYLVFQVQQKAKAKIEVGDYNDLA